MNERMSETDAAVMLEVLSALCAEAESRWQRAMDELAAQRTDGREEPGYDGAVGWLSERADTLKWALSICSCRVPAGSADAMPALDQRAPRWRPAVAWFADAMEQRLRANDHKGGWTKCAYGYLHKRLRDECRELLEAMSGNAMPENVLAEAADVANFAMMLADVYSRRPTPTEADR